MAISLTQAWWFLPFVLPICFYVIYTDISEMRITNQAVIAMGVVFLVIGLIPLTWPEYGMRLVQLIGVLVLGIVLNAAGVMGAGDAKFAAAAAPFIAPADLRFIIVIFTANLLAAYVTHRLAKHSPLRRIAPDWKSWNTGKKFPMGLALGGTLATYLIMGAGLWAWIAD
ncbi:MAG: prepilin peptidase [Rhodobacteraceae bacterium]|nr:prepilin peptidase [Paracoccaceae bacterium]